jgi:hypothetical protein
VPHKDIDEADRKRTKEKGRTGHDRRVGRYCVFAWASKPDRRALVVLQAFDQNVCQMATSQRTGSHSARQSRRLRRIPI